MRSRTRSTATGTRSVERQRAWRGRRLAVGRPVRNEPWPAPTEGRMNDRNLPSDPAVRAWAFRWGPAEDRRPGLPSIGAFLVVFGALLLASRMLPNHRPGRRAAPA